VWSPVLVPGQLALASGPREVMRGFDQEVAHFALHTGAGSVLWCDGDHGFNPYDFAELNLERGFDADWGADRLLVKRCMTPFQWDSVLTKHLNMKLDASPASLVLAAPYHSLYSTEELEDWERDDYVNFSLAHLKELARRHNVPVLLSIDMGEWCQSHPLLAWKAYDACAWRWAIRRTGDGWSAREAIFDLDLDSHSVSQRTISDFVAPSAWARPHPPPHPRESRAMVDFVEARGGRD
jgi:hypothetical protein